MIQLNTKIKQLSVESGKRILVTSDIHGHLSYLKNILKKVSFSDNDILFIVGDMIEKGPENLGALRYVMDLCKQKNVIPLIGNVDAYRLQLIHNLSKETATDFYNYILDLRKWVGSSFYEELAKECGYTINSPKDILLAKQDVVAHFKPEFDFISNLPAIVETQNYIFVHGGLREKEVANNENKGLFELTKFNAFMTATPHTFDKYVVVGHWPVALYSTSVQQLNPIIDRNKKIISIDGGCGIKEEGQLNLLVIPDINCSVDEISYVSYDEKPTITALDKQVASDDPIHISWSNNEIMIIEKGEEFSYIKHVHSGRNLYIPNTYITKDIKCSDYTDYILPVETGDTLSLISKTSKGCIVKKDGVVGWYCGKYESNQ